MDPTPVHPKMRRALTAMDRAGLWVVGVGAALAAVLHAVGIVVRARQTLGTGPLEVTDLRLDAGSTPEFTENLPAVTEAHYDTITVVAEGAPSLARWLLWGADTTSSLAAIGICLALVWLCVRVARRRPFGRLLTLALLVTATLVMVGGMLPQLLGAMGRAEIVDHVGLAAMAGEHGQGMVLAFSLELSFAPVGIGLVLGVVTAAFEIGERLQRDTEGLV